MVKINIITVSVLCTISLIWTPFTSGVKTSDVKDKRGTSQSSYGSVLSPHYSPPDHGQVSSGFTPVAAPVGVYPQTPSAINALLIPGNLLYGQGLDYSGLSYGGYGGYAGYPSVPASYPIGLLGSPQVAAYKLGPVTFNPAPAATPYVAAPAYPSYNILSSLNSDYAGIGSGYSLPSAPSYPSHNYGYSPSYASGSSYSSSYPSSSQSSYSSPSSHSSSTYSSSPPYSAFVGSHLDHQGGSSYSPYSSPSSYQSSPSNYHSSPSSYQSSPSNYQSSPSSYHSSSGYSSPGYSSQSSYSSPSNSYSHSSSSSYPSSAYGPPYKSSSGLSYKY